MLRQSSSTLIPSLPGLADEILTADDQLNHAMHSLQGRRKFAQNTQFFLCMNFLVPRPCFLKHCSFALTFIRHSSTSIKKKPSIKKKKNNAVNLERHVSAYLLKAKSSHPVDLGFQGPKSLEKLAKELSQAAVDGDVQLADRIAQDLLEKNQEKVPFVNFHKNLFKTAYQSAKHKYHPLSDIRIFLKKWFAHLLKLGYLPGQTTQNYVMLASAYALEFNLLIEVYQGAVIATYVKDHGYKFLRPPTSHTYLALYRICLEELRINSITRSNMQLQLEFFDWINETISLSYPKEIFGIEALPQDTIAKFPALPDHPIDLKENIELFNIQNDILITSHQEEKALKKCKEMLHIMENKASANEVVRQFCRHPLSLKTTMQICQDLQTRTLGLNLEDMELDSVGMILKKALYHQQNGDEWKSTMHFVDYFISYLYHIDGHLLFDLKEKYKNLASFVDKTKNKLDLDSGNKKVSNRQPKGIVAQ